MKFRVEKKSASIYEIISNPLKVIEKESLKITRCAATDTHMRRSFYVIHCFPTVTRSELWLISSGVMRGLHPSQMVIEKLAYI